MRNLLLGLTLISGALFSEELTQDQVNFFDANGYLIIEDFYSKETCQNLIERAQDIVSNLDQEGGKVLFEPGRE